MAVGPITGFFPTPQNFKATGASALQSIVGSLFSPKSKSEIDSVNSLTAAVLLQAQGNSFKQITTNLAKVGTQLQIAGEGILKIQDNLVRLQAIAQQASDPNLDPVARQTLSTQFTQLTNDINNIVATTKFGDQKLLNGSLSGKGAIALEQLFAAPGAEKSGEGNTILSIGDLSTQGLFGNNAPGVSSAAAASNALNSIGKALANVNATAQSSAAFIDEVSFITANFESSAENQRAAQAMLTLADFSEGTGQFSLLTLSANTQKALANAQGVNPALQQLASLIK